MKTVLRRFIRKSPKKSNLVIDEDIVRESRKRSEKMILDYKDYRSRDLGWLENHLEATENVVVKNVFGSKNKAQFIIDGYKFFKNEDTTELFNRLYENYNAYHIGLKDYIVLRKKLLEYSNLNSNDSVFVAGHVKEAEDNLSALEKKLNIYLDNINRLKKRIREAVGVSR